MEKETQTKNDKKTLIWIIFCILFCGLIFLLFYEKKTIIVTTEDTVVTYGALICERNHQASSDIIRAEINPTSLVESVSVVYRDKALESLFLSYSANYASEADGSTARSQLLSAYYEQIGKYGIKTGDYDYSSSGEGAEAMFTLMAKASNLKKGIGEVFFLDSSKNPKIMTVEEIATEYGNQGFSCRKEN